MASPGDSGPKTPVVFGRFRLLKRIATGGMAEIFLAREAIQGAEGVERLVIVKKILPHLANEERFRDMFLDEARIAAQLTHPNIVQVYDFGRIDESYFLSMEVVRGLPTSVLLKTAQRVKRPLPPAVVAALGLQALDALAYAHTATDPDGQPLSIVHRDVTPHNLMVTGDGLVKVLDFGIAKAANRRSHTEAGGIKGKYPYMSPEQVAGRPLDSRSDLFALAVILWELLTARRLFERESDLMVLKAIHEEPIPTPREIDPEIPEPLDLLLQKALQRDRGERYPDARTMRESLSAAYGAISSTPPQQALRDFLAEHHDADLENAHHEVTGVSHREQVFERNTVTSETPVLTGSSASRSSPGPPLSALPPSPSIVPAPDPLRDPGSYSDAGGVVRKGKPTAARRRKKLLAIILGLSLVGGVVAGGMLAGGGPSGPALHFGQTPFLPEDVLAREFRPVLDLLAESLATPFEQRIAKDYEALGDLLAKGEVEFGQLSSFSYIKLRREGLKLPLVAVMVYDGATTYDGYLVVRADSRARRLEELRGSRICYVDRRSTSGYLLPRVALRRAGHNPDAFFSNTVFSGNHFDAMRDLLAGKCEVAAIYSGAYVAGRDQGISTGRIRILQVTGQPLNDIVCAAPHTPTELVDAVRKRLLDLDVSAEFGQSHIGGTLRVTGYQAVNEADFAEVEAMADEEER